jgi:hypothetical protein
MNRNIAISCGVSFTAVAIGIAATLTWGGELPAWLLTCTLSLTMLLALAYGFTSALPRFDWLRSRPVKGAALVCLGVAAIFVPLSFVIASFCIGRGTMMVWETACEATESTPVVEARNHTSIASGAPALDAPVCERGALVPRNGAVPARSPLRGNDGGRAGISVRRGADK